MSPTLILILALSGFALLLFVIAQLGNSSRPERTSRPESRQQPPAEQGYPPKYTPYPPNYIPYPPPQPEHEERETSSRSIWPWAIVALAAIVFYMAARANPAEKVESPPKVADTQPDYDNNRYYYDYPSTPDSYENTAGVVSRDREAEKNTYAPPPIPNANTGNTAAGITNGTYPAEKTPAPQEYQAPDYSKGYGVQLFAREKDWWEEPGIHSIQQSLDGQYMLISKGYTRDGVEITKFIIGPFDTKKQADTFARRAGSKFPGAYTLELSSLERVGRLPLP